MTANREYKDSLFSWLFSNPETLRELYGALSGILLPSELPVIVNTLESALFKGLLNDISFIVGDRIVVLIEHQSTVNENMPLRLLLYIARLYEQLTNQKDLYRARKILLPAPEFIVLYNGAAPYPDETTLKLSDCFRGLAELGLAPRLPPALELIVKVYNINEGHNAPMIRRCKTLEGYSAFVARVREYEGQGKPRGEAVKQAVQDCIQRNILRDFLETHSKEIINMLMTEWNWDDALAVSREEGREEGREKGREEGRAAAAAEYAEQIRRMQERERQWQEEISRLRKMNNADNH
jgi:hypothetical protein